MTRIVLIDSDPIFRHGLALTLAAAKDLTLCAEGRDGAEALELLRRMTPDLLVLDPTIPEGGVALLRELRQLYPDLIIVALTAMDGSADVMEAMEVGVKGYILKGIGGGALIDAIRGLALGQGYVTPALAARLLTENGRRRDHDGGADHARLLGQLTPRERQVLELVAGGHSNKEIARRIGTQEKTVKHHMTRILHKLNARNRTEAALILRQIE